MIFRRLTRILIVPLMATVTGCASQTDMQDLLANGIGSSIETTTTADRTQMLEEYFDLMCARAGLTLASGANGHHSCPANMDGLDWQKVVFASLNDIDERCDGYLESLYQARRDNETAVKHLTNLQALTQAVMTKRRIDRNSDRKASARRAYGIVALTFNFAQDSMQNYYALINALEERKINQLVKKRQTDYRNEMQNSPSPSSSYIASVDSRPKAYFAIRGYLRLCIPSTIESEILTTLIHVRYSGGERSSPKRDDPGLQAIRIIPATPKTGGELIYRNPRGPNPGRYGSNGRRPDQSGNGPGGADEFVGVVGATGTTEKLLSKRLGQKIQAVLCVKPTGDFGVLGSNSPTRRAIRLYRVAKNYHAAILKLPSRNLVGSLKFTERVELLPKAALQDCSRTQFLNAYERFRYAKPGDRLNVQNAIKKAFDLAVARDDLRGLVADAQFADGEFNTGTTRAAIRAAHEAGVFHYLARKNSGKKVSSDLARYFLDNQSNAQGELTPLLEQFITTPQLLQRQLKNKYGKPKPQ